jgi:hypothetical protein
MQRLKSGGIELPGAAQPARKPRETAMFQISPLEANRFSHLFGLSDEELDHCGVVARKTSDGDRFPCRVSLRDARPGERALLLNFEHQPAGTPYRSSYAIFVIEGAAEAKLAPGELPDVFAGRPLAVRGFSATGMLLDAGMAMGEDVRGVIGSLFANPDVDYLHVHNAMHGCYSARVDRV